MKSPTFITSVAEENNFYKTDKPIIAIVGKSNVGKSSLINMLAKNSKLAKTSDTPGRTRLINYFDFDSFVLADLPGYGYAKVSKEEKEKWGKLLENFLINEKIELVISLVDIRHDPTEDDLMMINFMYHYNIPFIIVATKSDKLSKSKIKPQLLNIASRLKVGIDNIIASSSETGQGRSEIFSAVNKVIRK
ncbi:MAG: ribosome biogenesis GTP-binding protein YihA/YsxC [Clostridia bacterium]|nr:ribosome biogenesis GTP-binding protein YihA/YsxC [Clostridia bacterium]